jgi:hypothetical protein
MATIRYHANDYPVENVVVTDAIDVHTTDDHVTWLDAEGVMHAITREQVDEITEDD